MKINYQRDAYKCGNRSTEDSAPRPDYYDYPQPDRYDDNYDCCPYPPRPKKGKHDDKKDYYPQPKPETVTILRCGTATGSGPLSCNGILVDSVAVNGNFNNHAAVQATVALDTDDLVDATVKLDFSTLITFRTTDDDNYRLRLVYQLSRICNGSRVPLGTWTFERISSEEVAVTQIGEFVQQSDPFTFSFCSCDTCPGCCYYVVEIVAQECFNIDFVIPTNTSFSALAVGKRCY